jgi:O-acetyl-ADP-ribose deacetylase (regulator of RNase III)/NAD-dependent SIR2 family protein deacetylase
MANLKAILLFLLDEANDLARQQSLDHDGSESEDEMTPYEAYKAHLNHLEETSQSNLLHQLLCVRQPVPPIPAPQLDMLDSVFQRQTARRVLTRYQSIPFSRTVQKCDSSGTRLSLWRGDITTLAGVTAITNAANGQMLGCFQPSHRCIDNVIHSAAGPRLRSECHKIMSGRGYEDVKPGDAIVTDGYALPSPYVIHTVGPQLRRGTEPTEYQRRQLESCYRSILDKTECLPAGEDGRKAVAFCCISTGLFAFPAKQAAVIAIDTVTAWIEERSSTSITDVIFNVFTEADHEIYKSLLGPASNENSTIEPTPIVVETESLKIARQWLHSADSVLVSAAAGLSASDGLDYTSTSLFAKHCHGFFRLGLRRLYDVMGFKAWPTEEDRWGYYFTHLNLVQTWPRSPMYEKLVSWLSNFGDNAHVRTSNADGLFLANGLPEARLSTPQGRYSHLQCQNNCRPEATVSSPALVQEAQAFIDSKTQKLTDPSKVPRCRFCKGTMMLCVRGGSWFNEAPFREGEARWKKFRHSAVSEGKTLVILELGAGMNTPGVLRWPNERLVETSEGRVKLVRVALGQDSSVPKRIDDKGLAIGIDGDIQLALTYLLGHK